MTMLRQAAPKRLGLRFASQGGLVEPWLKPFQRGGVVGFIPGLKARAALAQAADGPRSGARPSRLARGAARDDAEGHPAGAAAALQGLLRGDGGRAERRARCCRGATSTSTTRSATTCSCSTTRRDVSRSASRSRRSSAPIACCARRWRTAHFGFYTAGEYDVAPLVEAYPDLRFLELGRSCVLPALSQQAHGRAALARHLDLCPAPPHRRDDRLREPRGHRSAKARPAAELPASLRRAPEPWRVRALDRPLRRDGPHEPGGGRPEGGAARPAAADQGLSAARRALRRRGGDRPPVRHHRRARGAAGVSASASATSTISGRPRTVTPPDRNCRAFAGGVERRKAFAIGRIGQRDAELVLDAAVRDALVLALEARRHSREPRLSNGTAGGGATPARPAA